jgi:hypothetical protein
MLFVKVFFSTIEIPSCFLRGNFVMVLIPALFAGGLYLRSYLSDSFLPSLPGLTSSCGATAFSSGWRGRAFRDAASGKTMQSADRCANGKSSTGDDFVVIQE